MTKNITTIPPDAAFIDRLAEGLWQQAGKDPFRLSEMLVLLPTRRACRYLREAFPRIANMRAALLPRMQPLGDLDEDEFYFTDMDLALPPAISPLRRQLLLARLIRQKDSAMPLDQAAQLAKALGQFLDQVQIERRDLGNLAGLAPENLAVHWQETVRFLEILSDAWPKMLAEEGCLDPAERRNRLIEMQAEVWRKNPAAYPVIAAGSTGSLPATADLLAVIAGLPNGMIVLPGLDQELDEEAWQAIEETHPQYGIKQLLEKCGARRGDIVPFSRDAGKDSPRVRLLQESMRPAEVTEAWRKLDAKKIPRDAAKGLTRLTLDNAQEEAQAIALMMRGALEVPEKTVALVTGDRALAERVAAQLARWGIEANDSAGTSLATQPVGSFMLDLLAAARPDASPVDILSLLKHPLAACGLDPAICRAQAREVEMVVWRKPIFEGQAFGQERSGPSPLVGEVRRGGGPQEQSLEFETSPQLRSPLPNPPHKGEGIRAALVGDPNLWLEKLKQKFKVLQQSWRKVLPLEEWIKLHITLAEQLAASDQETGADRLWKLESGEAAAEWLENLQSAAHHFPALSGEEYAGLFGNLLRAVTVRPNRGQHPRLGILGPLEARLLQADLTILAGLNEGNWPPETAIDPWMSRPMKKDFGLPLPERRIGLSAHDFVQLASAPEVVLTRARRAGNAPTVPSRFLLQLETVLRALGYHSEQSDALAPEQPWHEWARMLDDPVRIEPCAAPEPRPPASARPRGLRVTEIGTWRRNPYAIYARHILRLEKLEPLEQDATAADKGMIIHKALEIFLRRYPDKLPPQALDKLLKIGNEAFAAWRDYPQVVAFWQPRFERIAEWFIELEQTRRAAGIKNLKPEALGSMMLGDFKLRGRADRIDRLPDGGLAIIDYKTGGMPTQTDVRTGLEPQLPLLALIAAQGGFEGIAAGAVAGLAYWKLSGGAEPGEESNIKEAADILMNAARLGLESLIAEFADPATPYQAIPKPGLQPRYDDYAHLARLAEWGRTAEDV